MGGVRPGPGHVVTVAEMGTSVTWVREMSWCQQWPVSGRYQLYLAHTQALASAVCHTPVSGVIHWLFVVTATFHFYI